MDYVLSLCILFYIWDAYKDGVEIRNHIFFLFLYKPDFLAGNHACRGFHVKLLNTALRYFNRYG